MTAVVAPERAQTTGSAARAEAFAGTGDLVRLALRRSRIMITLWLLGFVSMAGVSASATVGLYPQEAARVAAAQTWNSAPALLALYGRIYDPTSIGALALVKASGLGAVFVAVLSILLVMRHTRADEESGRHELLGATAVGRRAPLTAALIVAMGADVVLGVLTALALIAAGLPVNGSFAFGTAWGGVGLAFAAVAAITAQLTSTTRAGTSTAVAVLGVVYLLRAIGDAATQSRASWLSWLSPVGWSQQFRPYAGNRWWVFLITLAFTVVATAAAYSLAGRRDAGAGLFPDRLGPAAAAPGLRSPEALAWRLQRSALWAWLAGSAVMGVAFGNLATNLTGFFDSQQAKDMFTALGGEKGLTEAYLAATIAILGVVASAYGIQAATRIRAEESAMRLETVLATASSRTRWLLAHGLIAMAGSAVLMAVVGLATGLSYGMASGHVSDALPVFGGALAQIPAAWVIVGIALVLFAFVPRFTSAAWGFFAAFLLLGELGPLLKLDQWVMDLSPFAHSPKLPGGPVDAPSLIALTALTVALVVVAVVGFRRRDVPVA